MRFFAWRVPISGYCEHALVEHEVKQTPDLSGTSLLRLSDPALAVGAPAQNGKRPEGWRLATVVKSGSGL